MDYEEAIHQLRLHTGFIDGARSQFHLEDGFLTCLRPYTGLQEKNFHAVMAALLAVGKRIHREPTIEREIVEAVWWMCYHARSWGVEPDGVLRRNELITPADATRLARWVDIIEQTMLWLLVGKPPCEAASLYEGYARQ